MRVVPNVHRLLLGIRVTLVPGIRLGVARLVLPGRLDVGLHAVWSLLLLAALLLAHAADVAARKVLADALVMASLGHPAVAARGERLAALPLQELPVVGLDVRVRREVLVLAARGPVRLRLGARPALHPVPILRVPVAADVVEVVLTALDLWSQLARPFADLCLFEVGVQAVAVVVLVPHFLRLALGVLRRCWRVGHPALAFLVVVVAPSTLDAVSGLRVCPRPVNGRPIGALAPSALLQ
mmetsp:Transcript_20308/g.57122  ORF Transcript_20308/g.57122 Transcript_20308/m.57122 type:complete len:240 (+) Transcript_20308:887-1606(+)